MAIQVLDKTKKAEKINQIATAMRSNDPQTVAQAWESFLNLLNEQVMQDVDDIKKSTDEQATLRARGYRILTPKEKAFYDKMIKAGKSANPKQEFTSLIQNDGMPETVIEDVYKDLKAEHPLLSRVNYVNVKYLTKWLLNDNPEQLAKWGEITDEIEKEITSGFRIIDIEQSKLSAFLFIHKSLLELGSTFLDNYVRTILKEAIAFGLEEGIINGSGIKGEIVGLNRNIGENVSINSTTGYPLKTAIEVTEFTPEVYGELVAKLVKSEKGYIRTVTMVDLIVNPIDYLTKIMPATTVLTPEGKYVNNVFPFPTNVIQSCRMPQGKAHMVLLDKYFVGVGMTANAAIEYSDHYKFPQDIRTYVAKLYAAGMPEDNNVSIVLDISKLSPVYLTVLAKGLNVSVVQGGETENQPSGQQNVPEV